MKRHEPAIALFWISLVLTIVTLTALIAIDLHLRNAVSPQGIVSFELCAFAASCGAIVTEWGPAGRVWAGLSLGVDYLFMFLYAATIYLGFQLVLTRVPDGLKGVATGAAWAVWGAAAADAVENYCLAQMLVIPSADAYALPAAIFATIKFVVLAATLGLLLVFYLRFARGPVRDGHGRR